MSWRFIKSTRYPFYKPWSLTWQPSCQDVISSKIRPSSPFIQRWKSVGPTQSQRLMLAKYVFFAKSQIPQNLTFFMLLLTFHTWAQLTRDPHEGRLRVRPHGNASVCKLTRFASFCPIVHEDSANALFWNLVSGWKNSKTPPLHSSLDGESA